MKKTLIILFSLALLFQSCEKKITSNDESRITYYANLALKGETDVVLKVGESFVEPGYEASVNGVDKSGEVVITGSVDNTKAGYYPLSYSIKNEDGFEKVASRNVFVIPTSLSPDDLTGIYTGLRVGKTEVAQGCTIEKLSDGFYFASDFFGGYYEVIAGYGAAYRLPTYFIVNTDNTIEFLSNDSPWGEWPVKEGVYSPADKKLTFQVWNGTFHFDVVLTAE